MWTWSDAPLLSQDGRLCTFNEESHHRRRWHVTVPGGRKVDLNPQNVFCCVWAVCNLDTAARRAAGTPGTSLSFVGACS